jgi:hypothetical protein
VASTAVANAVMAEADFEFYAALVALVERFSVDAVETETPIPCPAKVVLISKNQ